MYLQRMARAALVALLLIGGTVHAAEEKKQAVGKLVSAEGTLLARSKVGDPWRVVPAKGTIAAGELLVGLPGATVENLKGTVRLTFLSDLDKNSPYPILEAAAILHAPSDNDFDFTLDRGRIDVANLKDKGGARVGIRFLDQKWCVTLEEPGTDIALELYGRWPKGARFTTKPGPTDVPAADLLMLVRKGSVALCHGRCEHALSAPPGPALLHWDNSGRSAEAPQRLDKLPAWANAEASGSDRSKLARKVLEAFRQELLKSSPIEAARKFVQSEDPWHRRLGVVVMAAMDDMLDVGEVLRGTKYADTWDFAVIVVRNWIGRCPGQDQKLYRGLIEKRGIKPAEAATILQLLHSFGDDELSRPDVYRMLARYLDHDTLGIRGLAYWHLERLVPDGKKFNFDPRAPKEQREKASAQWQKLIEDKIANGELPPKQ